MLYLCISLYEIPALVGLYEDLHTYVRCPKTSKLSCTLTHLRVCSIYLLIASSTVKSFTTGVLFNSRSSRLIFTSFLNTFPENEYILCYFLQLLYSPVRDSFFWLNFFTVIYLNLFCDSLSHFPLISYLIVIILLFSYH